MEGGCYELRVGASCEDIRLRAVITVEGTVASNPYEGKDLLHYQTAEVRKITDAEFEALLGRPIPESKIKIDRNMTLGELSHGRSPLGWAASAVLGHLLRKSMENGKPDLNILFQYNMPCPGQDDQRCGEHGDGGWHRDGSTGILDHRPAAGGL